MPELSSVIRCSQTWPAARSIAELGVRRSRQARPQQGDVRAGEQVGAQVVGDGAPRQRVRCVSHQPAAHRRLISSAVLPPIRSCRKHLAHGEGFGPEAEHADNNSGLRGRLNDRHPLRDFHDGPGIHAHRKAEYTNATAPLPDSKINRGTYRLTEESIYELLDAGP